MFALTMYVRRRSFVEKNILTRGEQEVGPVVRAPNQFMCATPTRKKAQEQKIKKQK